LNNFDFQKLLDRSAKKEFAPEFLGLPEEFTSFDGATFVILPVPYDLTSTYNKGADKGPQALLQASTQLEAYDIETDSEVYRHGICSLAPLLVKEGPEELSIQVESVVNSVLSHEKIPIVIGGDHSVSIGAIAAAKQNFSGLSVLQLDAHGDTRESYCGSRFNHACVMARVKEICPAVQVGLRSIDASEVAGLDRDRTFYTHLKSSLSWFHYVASKLI
jgi:agmatinase